MKPAGFNFSVLFVSLLTCHFKFHSQAVDSFSILHSQTIGLLETNPEQSVKTGNAAYKLAISSGDVKRRSQAMVDLSYSYLYFGNFDSALSYGRSSAVLSSRYFCDSLYASSLACIGSVYFKTGRLDSALFYTQKSLLLREKTGLKPSVIKSLYLLGAISNAANDSAQAFHYFSRCLTSAAELADQKLLAKAHLGMGSWYHQYQLNSKAIQEYTKSSEICEKINDKYGAAIALVNLGSAYDQKGEPVKSLETYSRAISFFRDIGSDENIILCYSNIGATYMGMGETKKALHNMHLARENAIRSRLMSFLPDIYKNIAGTHSSGHSPDSALSYYEKFATIKDSLLSIEKIKNINELQEKYNKEKREAEILNLSAKAEMNHRKNILLLALSLSLAALCLMLYIIYRLRERASKALAAKNEQLYRRQISEIIKEQELKTINGIMEGQENERKRIAEDLHDRLGSMLATVKLHFNAIESKMDTIELKSAEQYNRANKLLDEVCNEVRRIAHNMESGVLVNFGLIPALTDLKEALEHSSTLSIQINSFGMNQRLNADTEISLYRIIQELLSNVIRHAKATEVNIDLNRNGDQITLMVSDNGIGFESEWPDERKGMGLKNIQSRVNKLQGKYFVDSGKGSGTTTIIEIPLHHAQADHS